MVEGVNHEHECFDMMGGVFEDTDEEVLSWIFRIIGPQKWPFL